MSPEVDKEIEKCKREVEKIRKAIESTKYE
jgi:hypothetical protein